MESPWSGGDELEIAEGAEGWYFGEEKVEVIGRAYAELSMFPVDQAAQGKPCLRHSASVVPPGGEGVHNAGSDAMGLELASAGTTSAKHLSAQTLGTDPH